MDARQKIEAAERELFERSALTRHLDKSEGEDAWGRPQYTSTHVDAMYAGWKARAELAAQTLASKEAEIAEREAEIARLLEFVEAVRYARDWYERLGEVCSFEGSPMIYSSVLLELAEKADALTKQPPTE